MAFWIIASKQYQEKYNPENFSALIPKPNKIIKKRPHQWWTKLTVGKPWCLATGSHCPPCRCFSEGVNSLVPLSPRWSDGGSAIAAALGGRGPSCSAHEFKLLPGPHVSAWPQFPVLNGNQRERALVKLFLKSEVMKRCCSVKHLFHPLRSNSSADCTVGQEPSIN